MTTTFNLSSTDIDAYLKQINYLESKPILGGKRF